jgi:alpha-1,3-fucosyltransferase
MMTMLQSSFCYQSLLIVVSAIRRCVKRPSSKIAIVLVIILLLCLDQIRQRRIFSRDISYNKNRLYYSTAAPAQQPSPPPIPPLKYILYYNKYWGSTDFQFGQGQQPFIDYGCPIHDCYATSNRSTLTSLSDFDAILFHVHRLKDAMTTASRHAAWRQHHQVFVMMTMESPLHDRNNYRLDYAGFFNATMTYRRDSDFPRPYGWFQRKQPSQRQQQQQQQQRRQEEHDENDWSLSSKYNRQLSRKWIPYDEHFFMQSLPNRDASFLALANRPKQVAWVVSHCQTASFREDYVNELREYISVDIYGKCGTTPCDQKYGLAMSGNCSSAIPRDYKFYLGLENAFCDDYVTEKFFSRVNDHVVIVLGQVNYSRVAPPHSYINVMDYDNPQHLANYLHQLDQNHSQYLSYFWWKDYYEVLTPSKAFFAKSMCRLCERLHQPHASHHDHNNNHSSSSSPSPSSVYHDMEHWWRGNAHCGDMMPAWKSKSIRIGTASKFRSAHPDNKHNNQTTATLSKRRIGRNKKLVGHMLKQYTAATKLKQYSNRNMRVKRGSWPSTTKAKSVQAN